MNLAKIRIDLDSIEKDEIAGVRVSVLTIPIEPQTFSVVGVDPGMNFGITHIDNNKTGQNTMRIMWGRIPTQKRPGLPGALAIEIVHGLALEADYGIVEGAAYHAKFGQVGLEEVRFGFFYGLMIGATDVHIIPPATVRKLAFGSGTETAAEIFPTLNHNAADSIGCALAAKEYLCPKPQ